MYRKMQESGLIALFIKHNRKAFVYKYKIACVIYVIYNIYIYFRKHMKFYLTKKFITV